MLSLYLVFCLYRGELLRYCSYSEDVVQLVTIAVEVVLNMYRTGKYKCVFFTFLPLHAKLDSLLL